MRKKSEHIMNLGCWIASWNEWNNYNFMNMEWFILQIGPFRSMFSVKQKSGAWQVQVGVSMLVLAGSGHCLSNKQVKDSTI